MFGVQPVDPSIGAWREPKGFTMSAFQILQLQLPSSDCYACLAVFGVLCLPGRLWRALLAWSSLACSAYSKMNEGLGPSCVEP
jgi:hypothetical protein